MPEPGLELLGHLLDASHDLSPDDLVATVARAAQALDAEDVAVYLVDYEQTLLVPLPIGTIRKPLEIDTTLAGRAFAAIAVQEADTGSGARLWLPLLDGAERLGVLGLTLPRIDDALRVRCTWLATLVAELLMTKGQYTDSYFLTRRRQSMGLAAEMQWQLLAQPPRRPGPGGHLCGSGPDHRHPVRGRTLRHRPTRPTRLRRRSAPMAECWASPAAAGATSQGGRHPGR